MAMLSITIYQLQIFFANIYISEIQITQVECYDFDFFRHELDEFILIIFKIFFY